MKRRRGVPEWTSDPIPFCCQFSANIPLSVVILYSCCLFLQACSGFGPPLPLATKHNVSFDEFLVWLYSEWFKIYIIEIFFRFLKNIRLSFIWFKSYTVLFISPSKKFVKIWIFPPIFLKWHAAEKNQATFKKSLC